MILIHCAFHPEAKPLIDFYQLKRDLTFLNFEFYKSERYCLIVSGIGKINTAIALTMAIATLRTEGCNLKDLFIINCGLAGGTADLTLGELYYVNKITDQATDNNFYPDLIYQTNLPQICLKTFDRPVYHKDVPDLQQTLVDMEASSFFQAASKFVNVHQIHCLKTLIDHLTPDQFQIALAEEALQLNLTKLTNFLNSLPNKAVILPSEHQISLEKVLDQVCLELQLSSAQEQQLRELTSQYEIATSDSFEQFLRSYHYKPSEHKSINTKSFEKLKAKLIIEIGKRLEN